MILETGTAPATSTAATHPQAPARLGDRTVMVDANLAPLIEALHEQGFTTSYSCQDTEPPHGAWRDAADKARFYVCFPDVEELRRLLPILERSDTLARSIRRTIGTPRWEFLLSHRGGDASMDFEPGPLRLQVSAFIPVEQLDLIVQTLRSAPD